MADDCIHIIKMGDSGAESDEKYEIYEAGSDMFCVIGLDSNKPTTGKTSVTKPRYKQSYREAWESMRDFKGWLSSVPGNTSKAYCKLCQKELHCHRLSLLKHKVTFKHQMKEEEHKLVKLRGENNENFVKINEDVLRKNNEERNTVESKLELKMDDIGGEEKTIQSETTFSEKTEPSIINTEKRPVIETKSLSTHVLDTSRGVPGESVQVILYRLIEGRWTLIEEGLTDSNGRCKFFVENQNEFIEGRYKLHFDVDKYFEKQSQETIFPFIEVVFDVKESSKYHIPLLLSPYGYTTYKGS